MAITPEDFEEFKNLLPPEVWLKKHVFDGGYAMMGVQKLKGRYEGTLNIGSLNLAHQFLPITEKAETRAKCCDRLDQRFRESMPDHQCGPGCFREWQSIPA
jgi:hypothetical protein